MTTLEMEIAMMQYLHNDNKKSIVPNISFGIYDTNFKALHECDLLYLSKSNYATEIEIKISKADLLKDKIKKHHHNHNHIKYLYFAVPDFLEEIAIKEIPERAGLYTVSKKDGIFFVSKMRKAIKNINAHKWNNSERLKFFELGTLRIYKLKKKILELRR